ncbi:uncharacterized protein L969DRAFT_62789 [Mixia osmundae IAM 14324]|uniref:Uncharacterized protein n=1 Tax=Mixia osmundae (strain CBS 9802 / IAM 14324 / JCM 22182 / KY 12970) TaxID=764103 RepID=G7E1Y2_MIXOS|nr:uncharacterized protein L969DRAFT_62789 [Mixia osmundae IAM 14324]KEI38646.1 hypothetical protein L969DRAFT_62789 [Mixia osmundae IAM 14324]GAA96895.1 hypothetical protein E5Q_03568 [Mixia osmundae IAM 14324]
MTANIEENVPLKTEEAQWDLDLSTPYRDPAKLTWLTILLITTLAGMLFLSLALNGPEDADDRPLHPRLTVMRDNSIFPEWPVAVREQCENAIEANEHWPSKEAYLRGRKNTTDVDVAGRTICDRSLTFLLDDSFDFAMNVNAVLQAFAYAEETDRAFFIDESQSHRSNWSTLFEVDWLPTCAPPPSEEMQGCPSASRHLMLTPESLDWYFGDEYIRRFGRPDARGAYRFRPIAERAFSSMDTVLQPSRELQRLVSKATAEMGHHGKLYRPYLGVLLDEHQTTGQRRVWNSPELTCHRIRDLWANLREEDFEDLSPEPVLWLAGSQRAIVEFEVACNNTRRFSLTQSHDEDLRGLSENRTLVGLMLDQAMLAGGFGVGRAQRVEMETGTDRLLEIAHEAGGHQYYREKRDASRPSPEAVLCRQEGDLCKLAAIQLGFDKSIADSRWVDMLGRTQDPYMVFNTGRDRA